jgi:hypothetical protein
VSAWTRPKLGKKNSLLLILPGTQKDHSRPDPPLASVAAGSGPEVALTETSWGHVRPTVKDKALGWTGASESYSAGED